MYMYIVHPTSADQNPKRPRAESRAELNSQMAVAAAVFTPRVIAPSSFHRSHFFAFPPKSPSYLMIGNSISVSGGSCCCEYEYDRAVSVVQPPRAVLSTGTAQVKMSDPELRLVLELASDDELVEIEGILFGTSYFSPLFKSISKGPDSDYYMNLDDMEERSMFISRLESRFLFLAADARSVIRGWRPSYRSVLFGVRKRLGVRCSGKLATEDLELEIFMHLLSEYSSPESNNARLETGLSKWKVLRNAALKAGAEGFKNIFFKGSGAFTVEKICEVVAKRLSGKMLVEAANYEIKKELIKRTVCFKGGQLAAVNLEAQTGFLAARQGLAHAATRYLGLRNLMMLIGPLMWGTLLADVVIQMLGTDYARIVRAIYAFAQIRLIRTNFWRQEA